MVDCLAELETLRREYERDEASFVVVYGRRRVGKTTLLVEFLKEKRGLYFLSEAP
ncbi:ATP-binding protein [Gordonibacter sp.]|uniref:ATP-binding protein n=1 Tax=Gordonibacter sp. TaxID=1968902 RepID=UPI002FC7FDB1